MNQVRKSSIPMGQDKKKQGPVGEGRECKWELGPPATVAGPVAAQGALGLATSWEQRPGSICLTRVGRKQVPGQGVGLPCSTPPQKYREAHGDLPGKTQLLRTQATVPVRQVTLLAPVTAPVGHGNNRHPGKNNTRVCHPPASGCVGPGDTGQSIGIPHSFGGLAPVPARVRGGRYAARPYR